MWRINTRVVAVCLSIMAFLPVAKLLAASETARDQDRISMFNSDLIILADGTLKVRETIRIHNGGGSFGNGLQRRFTSTRHDQHGRTWNVNYENIVILRDGNREPFTTETVDDNLVVKTHPAAGGLPIGDYTYELRYSTLHQFQRYGQTEELRRKPLGSWNVPVENFLVTIRAPAVIPETKLDMLAFSAATDSQLYCSCRVERNAGGEFVITSTGTLLSPEDLTFQMRFPAAYLERPRSEAARQWLENHGVSAAVGIFSMALVVNCSLLFGVLRVVNSRHLGLRQRRMAFLGASGIVAGLSLASMGVFNEPITGLPGSFLGILISMIISGTSHGPADRYSWIILGFFVNCLFYYGIIIVLLHFKHLTAAAD